MPTPCRATAVHTRHPPAHTAAQRSALLHIAHANSACFWLSQIARGKLVLHAWGTLPRTHTAIIRDVSQIVQTLPALLIAFASAREAFGSALSMTLTPPARFLHLAFSIALGETGCTRSCGMNSMMSSFFRKKDTFRSWLEIRGWHFDKNARQLHTPLARPVGGTADTIRLLRIVVTRGF